MYCDPEKVSRTLINLIINAIKFSPPDNTVRVMVSHCRINREVIFSVQDSGPGIEAEQREMIFARFRQVRSTLQSSTKGFGLGLNIAKELVDLNLGVMSLQSIVGEGSVFSFSVPIDEPWEVYKRFLRRLRTIRENRKTRVLAIKATIENQAGSVDMRETHAFLNYLLNSQDLLVPLISGEWLIILNAESSELETFLENAEKEVVQVNRNRPQGPLPGVQFEFAAEFDLEDGLESLRSFFPDEASPTLDVSFSDAEPPARQHLNIPVELETLAH